MDSANATDHKHAEILTHMLGASKHHKKSSHGFRNYFCAEVSSDTYKVLRQMAFLGLVREGRKINQDRDQYFIATEAGCKAIGLSKAATKRALSSN